MESIIKSLREQKGFSQEELAGQLGISRQTYIKYETGSVEMPLDVVRKVSQIFEIDYSCIIDNQLPKEPSYDIQKSVSSEEKPDIRISIPEKCDEIAQFLLVLLTLIRLLHRCQITTVGDAGDVGSLAAIQTLVRQCSSNRLCLQPRDTNRLHAGLDSR